MNPLAGSSASLTDLPIAWRPDEETVARSRLRRFMGQAGFTDLDAFLQWSVREPEAFWAGVVADLGLEFFAPWQRVMDASRGKEWTTWFPGGRLNYVHNAVDRWTRSGGDRIAVAWEGDDGASRSWTYAQLLAEVQRVAAGLRALGLRKGDRVGIFLPMLPETAAATLAVNRLGAIYVPIFSGYGAEAVAQRLRDCGARFLVTADTFFRRGRAVAMKEVADAAVAAAGCVERVVVVRRSGAAVPWDTARDVPWDGLAIGPEGPPPIEQTDPEDPCLIIYTSGTTGRPKGAVHPHCGFPLKAAQDMAHLFDVGEGDVLFWYSDLGWMMGPWAIMGALTLGATCVLFEGVPDYPDPDRIWSIASRRRVTVLGIAPTAIRALMAAGEEWPARHDLSSLRILGGTGEPWNPGAWDWYFSRIGGGRCPIVNYTGGTEISGGILGCVTLRPLRPCSFNCPAPGIDADVFDEEGRPVVGRVGELVIRNAWPGMTRGFWGDPERYLETYWSRWPGVWVHGDWALRTEDGFWYLLGRSDDTLKVAGKRVGPAEVEAAACAHPAVREAAAVGAPHPVKGESIVVFVVPRDAAILSGTEAASTADERAASDIELLRLAIRDQMGAVLGRALMPDGVFFVAELPKTRNAKLLRRVIRAVHLGEDPGDLSSLENPTALDAVRGAL